MALGNYVLSVGIRVRSPLGVPFELRLSYDVITEDNVTLRIVDKQVGDSWQRLSIKQLIVGDVFRVYEPDGELVPGMWSVLETPVCVKDVWGVVAGEVELQ
jgi:hypothetical protein